MQGHEPVKMREAVNFGWPSRRRHLTLALLCLTALFNMFDRQIMAILLEPIKKEFAASDTQMGLLVGSLFALFYVSASIPLGRLADTRSRKLLIAGCLTAWSLMSMLGGLTISFVQLALTRVGVAIGEAGSTPASYAIVADLYPANSRGKALSFYAAATSTGAGASVVLGGWLLVRYGWRTTLVLAGAPGLVIAALLFILLADPPRGLSDSSFCARTDAPVPLLQVLRYLRGLRSYPWILVTPAFCQVTLFGTLIWGPTFMLRMHALSPGDVGLLFGAVSTVALISGQLAGGIVADWVGSRDVRGYMWVSAAAAGLGMPAGLLFVFAENPVLTMIGYGLLNFCVAPITMCATVMAQTLVAPRMRAMSSTILLLVATMFGAGFAPLFVGLSNDFFQRRLGAYSIRYSLAVVVCFLALSSVSALIATTRLRSDYSRANSLSAEAG